MSAQGTRGLLIEGFFRGSRRTRWLYVGFRFAEGVEKRIRKDLVSGVRL